MITVRVNERFLLARAFDWRVYLVVRLIWFYVFVGLIVIVGVAKAVPLQMAFT